MENNKEFEKVFKKVLSEFDTLMVGREKFGGRELYDYRNYAKQKTDLTKADEDLSHEQKAWKIIYQDLDEKLEKSLGKEEKQKIDFAEHEVEMAQTVLKTIQLKKEKTGGKDNDRVLFYVFLIGGFVISWFVTDNPWLSIFLALLTGFVGILIGALIMDGTWSGSHLGVKLYKFAKLIGSNSLQQAAERIHSHAIGFDELDKQNNDPKKIINLCQKTDELLEQQLGYIFAHFDDSTTYKEKINSFTDAMLQKDITKEKRKDIANTILKVTEVHQNTLVNPLLKANEELHQILIELEKEIEKISNNVKKKKLRHWFSLTKEVYLNRRIQVNYIMSNEEWDARIPKEVLEHDGDTEFTFPSSFAEEMAKTSLLCKVAREKDIKMEKSRKKISAELFGLLVK